jgi:hypothetical protein
VFNDGSKYDGEYREIEGQVYRHGQGQFVCAQTQTVYTGSWDMNKMNGKGKIVYASGAFYEGNWKDNLFNGSGTYKWKDDTKLTGEWVENCLVGAGVYEDEQKLKWNGEFSRGVTSNLISYIQ